MAGWIRHQSTRKRSNHRRYADAGTTLGDLHENALHASVRDVVPLLPMPNQRRDCARDPRERDARNNQAVREALRQSSSSR